MKKLMLCLFFLSFVLLSGCSKNDPAPVQSSPVQNISGKVTSASTGLPIEEAVITTTPSTLTVFTDNTGKFEINNINAGTYKINVYEAGHSEFQQSGIELTSGSSLSLDIKLQELSWNFIKTDNNAVAAIQYSITPKISGVPLSDGDMIGVFYDSLGASACAGYNTWKSPENIGITIWGDDPQTKNIKEGFQAGEVIEWKIKRKSDGKVFDAAAIYQSGQGSYITNGAMILQGLQSAKRTF